MEGVSAGRPHVVDVVFADEGLEFGGEVGRQFVVFEVEDGGHGLVADGTLVGGVCGGQGEVVVGDSAEEKTVESEAGRNGLLEEVEEAEEEQEVVGETREGGKGGVKSGVGEAGPEVVILINARSRAVWRGRGPCRGKD